MDEYYIREKRRESGRKYRGAGIRKKIWMVEMSNLCLIQLGEIMFI
jgi:hypothetical protein